MALGRFKGFVGKVHETLEVERRASLYSLSDGESLDDSNESPDEASTKKTSLLREAFGDDMSHTWMHMFRHPSLQSFSDLKRKLNQKDEKWMQAFLDHGGLDALFDALASFNERQVVGGARFGDAVMFLECVRCLMCVMKSTIGLEYFIDNPDLSQHMVLGK